MSRSNVIPFPSAPALSWDDCRLLVESVVDYAIFMLDVEGHVVTWNLGAEKIKGYQADEILGEHFSKFYPPEDELAGKPAEELRIAAEEGRVEDEGWRVRKDGSRFWASVVITALRDETGELRGYGKVTRDLTRKREAEDELRQAEQRFHHLVDAVLDYAIFMLDATGHVSTWNRGAERLKGYSEAEILGKHFCVFYPPEERATERTNQILETVRREGRWEDQGWRLRKDGTRFWADVVITALRDEGGAVVGFAKVTRDLTERRRSEEKDRQLLVEQAAREAAEHSGRRLRASEQRYRALSRRLEVVLEGVDDGITVQDPAGRFVFANRAAARRCGFEFVEAMLAADPSCVVARFELLDETGNPFDLENLPARKVFRSAEASASCILRVRERASSNEWWSQVRSTAVVDEEGRTELAISIWHDVTVERLQEAQAKFLADATAALGSSLRPSDMLAALGNVVVPGLADWCATVVREGDELRTASVSHVDPAKREMARDYLARFPPDWSKETLVGTTLRSDRAAVVNDLGEAAYAKLARSPEQLEAMRPLGMKAILAVPLRVRERTLGVLILVSAESNRRFDERAIALAEELARRTAVALENAQLYEAAQQAATTAAEAARAADEANRAKDEFLATVSHELRTPLSAILGWSTLLRERVTDAKMVRPIEVIHRNAQAQVKIIDDILDISRLITGKLRVEPRPVDLVTIAKDAIDVVRPTADAKQIAIDFVSSDDVCLLVADPDRIQQVVWNLLSNAMKFTEVGGSVRVSIVQQGPQMVLEVSDTGIGIDPRFLPFVFERFRQADSSTTRRVGGLGLGLALVRHIVELHGGRAGAVSPGVGKGATFTVALPVRAVMPATPESARALRATVSKPERPVVDLRGVRVLVVDDELDARELVAAVLSGAGADVATASSAAEGFDAFERFQPDVLVSDVGMPEEDGYSFMRRIRSLSTGDGKHVPSLALSAFARKEDHAHAVRAGYTVHLGKPVSPDVLVAAVGNLAGVRRRPAS